MKRKTKEAKSVENRKYYVSIRQNLTDKEKKARNKKSKKTIKAKRKKIRTMKGAKGELERMKYRLQRQKHNRNYYKKKQMKSPEGKLNRMCKLLLTTDWDKVNEAFTYPLNGARRHRSSQELISNKTSMEPIDIDNFLDYADVFEKGEFIFSEVDQSGVVIASMITCVTLDGKEVVIPKTWDYGVAFGDSNLFLHENEKIFHNMKNLKKHNKFQYVGQKKTKSLDDPEDFCRDLLEKFDKFVSKSSADALNEDRMWTAWILDICRAREWKRSIPIDSENDSEDF